MKEMNRLQSGAGQLSDEEDHDVSYSSGEDQADDVSDDADGADG